ncbi:glycosyltransferase [Mangrovicoccus sp. HB161399]|uniref:glycosyltransferase n=1 Tax=Mangrovicoccus sp. HB161399 TaxID=2720392 RepID=UPI001552E493|nr:glycosyltransferase [Mangrovicoccus sp. HB161399]
MTDAPIRLLFILPSICRAGGGVSEAARLLAHGLARRRDISLEIVTVRSRYFEEDILNWPNVPVHAFERKGNGRFGYAPDMLRFLKETEADVAHIHGLWMYHVYAALRWSVRWKAPYVVTPHGMLEPWIMRRSSFLKWLVSTVFQNKFLNGCSMIQALTRKELEDIAQVVSTDKTAVIPNFVQVTPDGGLRPNWWRKEMERRRVVLFLGRIHDKKGWRELCEAWGKLSELCPDFRINMQLVFCGWIDDAPEFEAMIKTLADAHGNVFYAGPQFGEEKSASFYASDAFILPSKSEGLPMVILEAWASKLTVLMTNECNLPDGFEQRAAIRIGQSTDELVKDLKAFHETSDQEIQAIAERGLVFQSEHYSEKVVCDKFVSVYRSVLSHELVPGSRTGS